MARGARAGWPTRSLGRDTEVLATPYESRRCRAHPAADAAHAGRRRRSGLFAAVQRPCTAVAWAVPTPVKPRFLSRLRAAPGARTALRRASAEGPPGIPRHPPQARRIPEVSSSFFRPLPVSSALAKTCEHLQRPPSACPPPPRGRRGNAGGDARELPAPPERMKGSGMCAACSPSPPLGEERAGVRWGRRGARVRGGGIPECPREARFLRSGGRRTALWMAATSAAMTSGGREAGTRARPSLTGAR